MTHSFFTNVRKSIRSSPRDDLYGPSRGPRCNQHRSLCNFTEVGIAVSADAIIGGLNKHIFECRAGLSVRL